MSSIFRVSSAGGVRTGWDPVARPECDGTRRGRGKFQQKFIGDGDSVVKVGLERVFKFIFRVSSAGRASDC